MSLTERHLEDLICASLLADDGYRAVKVGTSAEYRGDFDAALGLDTAELFAFIAATQADAWETLTARHGGAEAARTKFAQRLAQQIDERGTVDVLRHGLTDHGVEIRLAYFRPAHGITPELVERHAANRLTVTRQLPYETDSGRTLDLALFVNGIPVATAELKHEPTAQSSDDAVAQYRRDRDPANLTLARRAVVHFALDTTSVMMTTRLAGPKTRFLPFNRGQGADGAGRMGAAGNPPNPANPDGVRTAYLWERVWERGAWLDLLHRFVHVTRPEGSRKGRGETIFPRYHQWDAVLRLEAHARERGAGHSYLIEHSAGSGKSNTIAWLAHRLSSLHAADDRPVFDKVVVITDRVVLDRQLQHTIYQFEHQHGLVERIDGSSQQLEAALAGATARIIITTLQKFPVVLKRGAELPDRRYAVMVDEAHSSQTGDAAKDVKRVLGTPAGPDAELAAAEAAEATPGEPPDPATEALEREVAARGRQPNLSFFAFTATPKERTLGIFGTPDPASGRHRPFHVYSMRQAIEEGFILDVLRNYTTYADYWRVREMLGAGAREYAPGKAATAIRRFVSLHDENIDQKARTIIDHFRARVAGRIGGRAKAMVVTASRLHAVRYGLALRRYAAVQGVDDLGALVAFSGQVADGGVEWTESSINGFPESRTPERFASDDFQILVVAEKYQTGFDQPLLSAMYVDKTLTGVAAVQTLSRLNRIHVSKEDTFVLDFRNEGEQIQAAFAPYFETTVAVAPDPNRIHDTRRALDEFDVLRADEVRRVAELLLVDEDPAAVGRVHAALAPAVDRFAALEEDEQDGFRDALDAFIRTYSYLSQVVAHGSAELEADYLYCKPLARLIRRAPGSGVDLGQEIELTHLRQELKFEGSLALDAADGELGDGEVSDASPRSEEARETLAEIIDRVNRRYGAGVGEGDRLARAAARRLIADEQVQAEAAANPLERVQADLHRRVTGAAAAGVDDHQRESLAFLASPGRVAATVRAVYEGARVAAQATQPVGELLARHGEDQHLEAKTSLRTSAGTGEIVRSLETACVKTVAAFLNSHDGGTLLIGVAEEGHQMIARGLAGDFASLRRPGRADADVFRQHLVQILERAIGASAVASIRIDFPSADGIEICRVHASPHHAPVWAEVTNVRDGRSETRRRFYVRLDAITVDLADRERELDSYLSGRWPDERRAA